jgi:endonuclease/exonuclease/phosphatase family metal-dependent hydrolase
VKNYFFILNFLFLFSTTIKAAELTVMSYNTMCKICDQKHKYGTFDERMESIADTVKRNVPDLLGTQEFQSAKHVKQLEKLLNFEYVAIYKKHTIYPATDSVIFVKKSRFEILSEEGVWLGPKAPHFNFGWKFRTPRRFHWVHLRDKYNNKEFIYANTHFDSNSVNSLNGSIYVQTFLENAKLPIIFSGDTNLTPDREGYEHLIGNTMLDTFESAEAFVVNSNTQDYTTQDFCSDGMSAKWPDCRIDHLLISKNSPWRVKTWAVDIFKYLKGKTNTSDHRAVLTKLIDN